MTSANIKHDITTSSEHNDIHQQIMTTHAASQISCRLHDDSLPWAPTAVHIRASEPPGRFEPFHRLEYGQFSN